VDVSVGCHVGVGEWGEVEWAHARRTIDMYIRRIRHDVVERVELLEPVWLRGSLDPARCSLHAVTNLYACQERSQREERRDPGTL
jgi:hypothetical protein